MAEDLPPAGRFPPLGRAKPHRRCVRPLHRVRQAHAAAQSRLDGLRIVVDCANGAAYKVAPTVLWELGAEVIAIGVEPGRLQHQPRLRLDASRGAARKVREVRADIGIALDGDADRVIIVDERARSSTATRSWR
jgi:phosphoglucosamine mutase